MRQIDRQSGMNMIRGYITVAKGCKYGNAFDINNIYIIEREICVQPIHIYINSIGRVSVLPTFWHCERTLSDMTSNHLDFTMSTYLSIYLSIYIYKSIYLSIYLSIYIYVYQSIYLFIYLSVFIFLSNSLSPLLFISLSLTHTQNLSFIHSLSLYVSRTHAHTHTHSLFFL